MILFYDTETTGLPPRNGDLMKQPRLVQLGALLCTEDGNEIASIDVMVKPEGFLIPDQASAVHGISTDMAELYGLPLKSVLSIYHHLRAVAQSAVGHNVAYDEGVMAGEYHRNGLDENWARLQVKAPASCTALLSEPIIKLPPTERMLRYGYGPFKKPNLMEAHKYYLGEAFEGAHSALADVRACARIFFAMRQRGEA